MNYDKGHLFKASQMRGQYEDGIFVLCSICGEREAHPCHREEGRVLAAYQRGRDEERKTWRARLAHRVLADNSVEKRCKACEELGRALLLASEGDINSILQLKQLMSDLEGEHSCPRAKEQLDAETK